MSYRISDKEMFTRLRQGMSISDVAKSFLPSIEAHLHSFATIKNIKVQDKGNSRKNGITNAEADIYCRELLRRSGHRDVKLKETNALYGAYRVHKTLRGVKAALWRDLDGEISKRVFAQLTFFRPIRTDVDPYKASGIDMDGAIPIQEYTGTDEQELEAFIVPFATSYIEDDRQAMSLCGWRAIGAKIYERSGRKGWREWPPMVEDTRRYDNEFFDFGAGPVLFVRTLKRVRIAGCP